MAASLQAHDCYGSIVRVEDGDLIFLCDNCGRPHAVLNKGGLHTTSKHGKEKDKNSISLNTLKWAIGEIERTSKRKHPKP
jgi:hypothetical protein